MNSAAYASSRAREAKQKIAIQAIAETGILTVAAKRAGVDRNTIMRWKKNYPAFMDAFDQALEISIDLLEVEARNRAIRGVKEPVFYKGEIVGHIEKPSDRLMELLLRAHRPEKYADRQQIDLNAVFSVEVAGFAAPGSTTLDAQVVDYVEVDKPSGDTAEGEELGNVAASRFEGDPLIDPPTPKLAASPISEGIDIADFSNIFL
jgi:hypothetical protein